MGARLTLRRSTSKTIQSLASKRRELFESSETYGASLLLLCVDMYGVECLYWHPETLKRQLEDDLSIDELSEFVFNKLMVSRMLETTDFFYKDVKAFVQFADTLSGEQGGFTDVREAAWAIAEAFIVDPQDIEETGADAFDEEIRHYLGYLLDYSGIKHTPMSLAMAIREKSPHADSVAEVPDPEFAVATLGAEILDADGVDAYVATELKSLVGQIQDLPLTSNKSAAAAEQVVTLAKQYVNFLQATLGGEPVR